MKLLLLGVWLGLAWAQQDQSPVPVQPGFHPEQVEGPWHTIKLGATNRSVIEEGGSYLCFMSDIKLLEDGNLNITYFHKEDGVCVQEFYIGEKTSTPGRFTFEYEGKNFLTFVATGHDFLIMDLENHNEAGILIVVELHGRTFLVDKEGQEVYRKHTLRRGIGQDHIVDLSAHVRCTSLGS
ncbi:lipocalin Can f 6.0101-like isoform X1 [Sciurus carolinensis]|uniref:lipocalin Can f 6.0101-like isoform X1 n=1 Tax=Sciurus carolinensis TaxID=30640 RepID=UPI001FB37249|nr:lipocalin Can f 6.0101-like isoform X1 [Sciurus carolinensis]XP_047379599.1 lipocalin Can f 6.0101-like isoform X2 [Sciurus carolinensis]XP_047379600.1 lipocalin Can f 6.0101-like isoform X1 [Sciurus carolinensis]